MTRRRCRRGGRGLFLQNRHKQPQTLRGRINLLLPPLKVHTNIARTAFISPKLYTTLLPPVRRNNNQARFWLRPPTRANLKATYTLRMRHLRYLRRRAFTLSRSKLLYHKSRVSSLHITPLLKARATTALHPRHIVIKNLLSNTRLCGRIASLANTRVGSTVLQKSSTSATTTCGVLSTAAGSVVRQKAFGL